MEGPAIFFRVFQDGFGLSTEWCNMPLLRLAMISLSPPLVSRGCDFYGGTDSRGPCAERRHGNLQPTSACGEKHISPIYPSIYPSTHIHSSLPPIPPTLLSCSDPPPSSGPCPSILHSHAHLARRKLSFPTLSSTSSQWDL